VEFVGLAMIGAALLVWRLWLRRPPDPAVPDPIADRGDHDVHYIEGPTMYSTSSLRVRAQSHQGVRLARGSVPPPMARTVSGEMMTAIPRAITDEPRPPRIVIRLVTPHPTPRPSTGG